MAAFACSPTGGRLSHDVLSRYMSLDTRGKVQVSWRPDCALPVTREADFARIATANTPPARQSAPQR